MTRPDVLSRMRAAKQAAHGGAPFGDFANVEVASCAWDAVLESEAPVEEAQVAPVDYTGDADFSERGKYSGVGVVEQDDPSDFDPEPAVRAAEADAVASRDGEACAEPGVSAEAEPAPSSDRASRPAFDLATFRELYRSRDGRLCFYEDPKTGHLAAVDASKLA